MSCRWLVSIVFCLLIGLGIAFWNRHQNSEKENMMFIQDGPSQLGGDWYNINSPYTMRRDISSGYLL